MQLQFPNSLGSIVVPNADVIDYVWDPAGETHYPDMNDKGYWYVTG